MASERTNRILERYRKAYMQIHGMEPRLEVKGGWVYINNNLSPLRIGKLAGAAWNLERHCQKLQARDAALAESPVGKKDFVRCTVSVVCSQGNKDRVEKELEHIGGQLGVYCIGLATQDLTDEEWTEVSNQVPQDILEEVVER